MVQGLRQSPPRDLVKYYCTVGIKPLDCAPLFIIFPNSSTECVPVQYYNTVTTMALDDRLYIGIGGCMWS